MFLFCLFFYNVEQIVFFTKSEQSFIIVKDGCRRKLRFLRMVLERLTSEIVYKVAQCSDYDVFSLFDSEVNDETI